MSLQQYHFWVVSFLNFLSDVFSLDFSSGHSAAHRAVWLRIDSWTVCLPQQCGRGSVQKPDNLCSSLCTNESHNSLRGERGYCEAHQHGTFFLLFSAEQSWSLSQDFSLLLFNLCQKNLHQHTNAATKSYQCSPLAGFTFPSRPVLYRPVEPQLHFDYIMESVLFFTARSQDVQSASKNTT